MSCASKVRADSPQARARIRQRCEDVNVFATELSRSRRERVAGGVPSAGAALQSWPRLQLVGEQVCPAPADATSRIPKDSYDSDENAVENGLHRAPACTFASDTCCSRC